MSRFDMIRDMARGRGRRDMTGRMSDGNDYARRRDYARGRRRDYAGDYSRGRDMNYGQDYARSRDYGEHEYLGPEYPNRDMARRMNRQSDGHYMYPFELSGRVGMEEYPYYEDMMYDYGRGRDYHGAEMLSNRELMDWSQKLMEEVEEKEKAYLKYDNVEKKAKEMGIEFKDFTFDEFYTTVLMMVTDYCKTLGTANMDIYLKLAKDWLCDKDVSMKYGEKLSAYYDYVVMGM